MRDWISAVGFHGTLQVRPADRGRYRNLCKINWMEKLHRMSTLWTSERQKSRGSAQRLRNFAQEPRIKDIKFRQNLYSNTPPLYSELDPQMEAVKA